MGFWGTGIGSLRRFWARDSDPFNGIEPVDSSAAAIAAQGLIRLGRCLRVNQEGSFQGEALSTSWLHHCPGLFAAPYLSTDPRHRA